MVNIEGYERFKPIGSGGFSQVYEAHQIEFNRRVAVKLLTLSENNEFDRLAFEGECRSMGAVSEHPNIVTVYGAGISSDGMPYIVMELYRETLLDRIRAHRFLSFPDVLDIGVQMSGALQRAHGERLLHRDIKPQNIFFSNYGDPALGDFGIAALANEQSEQRSFGLTLHYAAPEVLDGQMPTVASDLYSLGATLYTALAGHRPFARPGEKETEAKITNRILTDPPPTIGAQNVPPNIERTFLGLLAKHPNDRPRTARDVGELLRSLQQRLDLPQTVLRTGGAGFDEDLTQPRTPPPTSEPDRPGPSLAAERSSPAAEPVHTSGLGLRSSSESVTVYRSTAADRKTSDYVEPPPDRRPLYGLISVVSVAVLVAGAYFALTSLGSPSDPTFEPSEESSPPTSVSTTVIDIGPAPDPPTNVVARRGGDGLTVEWVSSSDRWRIDFVNSNQDPVIVSENPANVAADIGDIPCVTVRAISPDGRLSPTSETVCLTE